MRKTIGLVLVLASIAVIAQTYTNGIMSPRLPISDEQFEALRVARQIYGATNVTLNEFATNHLRIELTEDVKSALAAYRYRVAIKVNECRDETKLRQIEQILNTP